MDSCYPLTRCHRRDRIEDTLATDTRCHRGDRIEDTLATDTRCHRGDKIEDTLATDTRCHRGDRIEDIMATDFPNNYLKSFWKNKMLKVSSLHFHLIHQLKW